MVVFFTDSAEELRDVLPRLVLVMPQTGGLWIAWPKRASGVPTDLTEDVVREIGLAASVVDNKVCAIDDTWSALRFVIRLRDRKTKTLSDLGLTFVQMLVNLPPSLSFALL